VTVESAGQSFRWSRSATRTLPDRIKEGGDTAGARSLSDALVKSLGDHPGTAPLPFAVFYPTNRAVLDIPLRIRTRHNFDQLDAFELAAGQSTFRLFFEWFRGREDLENELRLKDPTYRDKLLAAVRAAIEALVPGFSDLRVTRAPLRMLVTKQGADVEVNQLSDGEKCLLAMTADLARRLALANPAAAAPLHERAIVLIDEIDLHLHPAWQRTVLAALLRTFPGCQFLVSTHSPQVLSEVPAGAVRLLQKHGTTLEISPPAASFGRDSNRILEDLMGVEERPASIKSLLNELFQLIDRGDLSTAREKRREIAERIGEDEPELVRADVLMRRREIRDEANRQAP
jgi:predicted ATP-binding protein involved in virulence